MRPIKSLLAGFGLLVLLLTFTPAVGWYGRRLAGPWNDPRGDVLIVLGAAEPESDGILSESSYWRSAYAVRAWREGGFRLVVLSGARVAESMRAFLVSQGVPGSAIRLENRSTSTRENALYTRDLLGGEPGRKVLLTSDFHMFRARRVFAKAGLEVTPRPFPDVLKRASRGVGRWPAFLIEVEETVKIGYYFARGWM